MKRGAHTTQQLILQAGKQEFLRLGFQKASLREIAKQAGVTTGAIYGYYPDKESLFHALVEEPAEELLRRFLRSQQGFDGLPSEEKSRRMDSYTVDAQDDMMEYVYDNLDAFRLIVVAAHGTRYTGYIDKLVEIEEEYMLRFLDDLRALGHPLPEITGDVVHILCSACFHGLFELVAHDLPREEALQHINTLASFYRSGWAVVLGL